MRFPESWSSTSLAKNAVLGTAEEIFVLDNAFALLEGTPRGRNKRAATACPILQPESLATFLLSITWEQVQRTSTVDAAHASRAFVASLFVHLTGILVCIGT